MWLLLGFQKLIKVYQRTFSPDHGLAQVFFPHGVCRFDPTCSHYMYQATRRYGWRGLSMGIKRIMRCHPFSKGGADPLL